MLLENEDIIFAYILKPSLINSVVYMFTRPSHAGSGRIRLN